MKKLEAFQHGDGAHCGLSDWYPEKEAALAAALADGAPFDTGWYSSKKEIASARIYSLDGKFIQVEASVSDDFDTCGNGGVTASEATLESVAEAVAQAWEEAEIDRDINQTYEGFSILKHQEAAEGVPLLSWVETYLVNIGWGEDISPPGDSYHWWGWQYDGADDTVGVPHPDIPVETVAAFEKFANDWAFGRRKTHSLRIGDWEIKAWRKELPEHEDPNDYAGMGWVGRDGRP
jgi:hypothetical protein